MRRRERYFFNGLIYGGLAVSAVDMLFQYFELKNENKTFWDNWNYKRTLSYGITGGLAAGGIGVLIYYADRDYQSQMPFDSESHTNKVANNLSIRRSKALLRDGLTIRNEILDYIKMKFATNLAAAPILAGSYIKGTAINDKFDYDIVLPFSKKMNGSLESIYDNVFETLKLEFEPRGFHVRLQKRSIGLTYRTSNNNLLHYDIVPAREINDYNFDKSLNLFQRADSIFSEPTYIKTNVELHKKTARNRAEEKKVIRLIKHYRDINNLPLPSIAIEKLVLEAFERLPNMGVSSFDNFMNCLKYVANNATRVKLVDIANTNNNLLSKLSESDKLYIQNQMNSDLDKIAHDATYLREIFEL